MTGTTKLLYSNYIYKMLLIYKTLNYPDKEKTVCLVMFSSSFFFLPQYCWKLGTFQKRFLYDYAHKFIHFTAIQVNRVYGQTVTGKTKHIGSF